MNGIDDHDRVHIALINELNIIDEFRIRKGFVVSSIIVIYLLDV